ncbi:hypothetical protein HY357_02535 [Candidatus Roizmanbacteria bacterium]|nr:hypothetical protein [Candidatus Roizmanbacteria bacterium]
MLTIICGEDTSASRNYFLSLKKDYKEKGYEIRDIRPDELSSISLWLGESPSLFSIKRVFFSQNVNKYVRRDSMSLINDLKKLEKNTDVELIMWESVSLWELRLSKLGKVKEFRPRETIFKLLDSAYPGNRNLFISLLNSLSDKSDENFIFLMLVRQIKNLLLLKQGFSPVKMQSWQTYKLKSIAKSWKLENLISFYEALFKIEVGLKTGTNPYSIKESLDILACHFL